MITYIAFLKNVNQSGQPPVKMEELRYFIEIPGIFNASTYAQSGNIIFESEENDESVIRKAVEFQLHKHLGYPVTAIIRMAHELKSVLQDNPYDHIKTEDTVNLYVTFLEETPPVAVRASLGVHSNDAEYARLVKRNVYVRTSNYGKTCFSNSYIEKKMGMEATTRNWATVSRIVEQVNQQALLGYQKIA